MEVSIIVPTYNRAKTLEKCISKLLNNNFPKNKYEIIIIDDSSNDNTQEIAEEISERNKNIRYYKQKKSGQGVARNLAITESKGKILIFIGDDIFTTKNFIQEHFEFHRNNPQINIGMLGLILWDPDLEITNYMKWSTQELTIFGKFGGHQFAFKDLKKIKPNYKYFYTSNISLKKEILSNDKFDPWFEGYGWEDIELGYRLEKKLKLKLEFNPNAVAYHHHNLNDLDLEKRMYSIGKAAYIFQNKHPELEIIPTGKKLLIFKIISSNLFIIIIKTINKITNQRILPIVYYALSKKYFLKGLQSNFNKK